MDDDLEKLVANVEALHAGPDDLLVLSCPGPLALVQIERLRHDLESRLPGRSVLVLDGGAQLTTLGQHRQLERIERNLAAVQAALGAVLQALTKDEEPAESRTLDGELFPSGERDQTRPL